MSLLLPSFYRCPSEAQRGRTVSSRSPELAAAAFLSPVIPLSDCCVTSRISLAPTLGLFLLPSCPPCLSVSPKGSSVSSHLLKCPSPGAPAHSFHTSCPLVFHSATTCLQISSWFASSQVPLWSFWLQILCWDTPWALRTESQTLLSMLNFPRGWFRTWEGSFLSCFYVPRPHPILGLNHCHFSPPATSSAGPSARWKWDLLVQKSRRKNC